MELKGNYTFDAPQEIVWEALNDPNVLGSVMPGSEGFEEVGDNEYAGKLKVRVGPVQGNFEATIKLVDINKPDSYTINIDGKGSTGNVKATGNMNLKPEGDDKTYLEYTGSAQISGRIASVGQRLMDSTARSIIRQSLTALNEYLKVQVAQQELSSVSLDTVSESVSEEGNSDEVLHTDDASSTSEVSDSKTAPSPVPEYKAPSEVEIGLNVARDVFNDMVPEKYQSPLIIGILTLIGIIIWLIIN